jgi:nicotinamidase-related amidase
LTTRREEEDDNASLVVGFILTTSVSIRFFVTVVERVVTSILHLKLRGRTCSDTQTSNHIIAESIRRGGSMSKYTKPNLNTSCLITVDVQNDFTLPGAVLEIEGTADIVPQIVKLLKAYRNKQLPIIHIVRLYQEDGSNVDACRREQVEDEQSAVKPGSEGAELVSILKPSPQVKLDASPLLSGQVQQIGENEFVIYKPRWGAFFKTPLETRLKELGCDTLTFTGCNFPNCPRTSIFEASERDFRLVAVSDAISGIYEQGIRELENIGVEIITTDELIKRLR